MRKLNIAACIVSVVALPPIVLGLAVSAYLADGPSGEPTPVDVPVYRFTPWQTDAADVLEVAGLVYVIPAPEDEYDKDETGPMFVVTNVETRATSWAFLDELHPH